jgi:phosphatidylglycerol:prolipoprotein diacylglycerol transferase
VYPVLLRIGSFEISTFGVMMAAGFLVGGGLYARAFEEAKLSPDDAWRLLFWALVGGVVGSKLWFVAEVLARNPGISPFGPLFSRGGLTWYGGLAGGALAGIGAALARGFPVLRVVDLSGPSLAIGQALGRVGCFLVGDDWGRVTDLPWGIAFPRGIEPTVDPVHPTQLYEFGWLAAGAALLWSRRARSPFLFGEYLVLAGLGRFWIELFRLNPPLLGPLTNAQAMALACAGIGVVGWIARAHRSRRSVNGRSSA